MKATKLLLFCIIIINSFSSCYQDTGDFFRTNTIFLSADSQEKRPGKTINFTINTDSGIDVSNESTIYIQEVSNPATETTVSNTPNLTSQTITSYKVYAKYKDLKSNKEFTSNEIIVNFNNKKSFVKRVLIEDYTGAWCVSCPRVSYSIDLLKLAAVKVVPVAIHRGNSPGSFDPYNFEGAVPLETLVEFFGEYPTGKINRMTPWPYAQNTPENQNFAKSFTTGTPVRLDLAMNASLNGTNVNLDVKVKFFDDYSNLRLVVYVLENDLIYPQKNSTNFYGGLSVIPDFEHDHVVRATFTDILGDAIPSGETFFENVYTRNFSIAVPSNIADVSNIEFVAFVVGQDNKAINVRSATIGDNQDFEENIE